MLENSIKVVHYTFWGSPNRLSGACGTNTRERCSARHEYVTCSACKDHPSYRTHVIHREIAYDGNFVEFDAEMKRKFIAGESTE